MVSSVLVYDAISTLKRRSWVLERIRVTAHLDSPLVTGGGYMTLDGLLGAILFDELQDVDAAHAAIPVRRTDDLFHASAAILEHISSERVAFIAALREKHAIDPAHILKNKHGQLHRKFDTAFSNVMNSYRAVTSHTAVWFAEGDAARIEGLLSNVKFIGKRRASGFGRVKQWVVDPDEYDGIHGPLGDAMRPVPQHLFHGDKSLPLVDAAWKPAYWRVEHRAACYVPF